MPQVHDALLTLVIGVTGHRDIPVAEHAALHARVTDLIRSLRAQFPHLPLLMLNPLAEGGDRIAARAALAQAVPLFVPLPFSVAEYEKDFETAESLAEFRELLAGSQVRVLPLAPGITEEAIRERGQARNLQYAQLGMFISSHCQVLLALWDGKPSTALGGTGQVVAFHIANVMPEVSAREVAPNLLADDESDLVFHIACSRQLAPGGASPLQVAGVGRWVTAEGTADDSVEVPAAYRRVFAQMSAFNLDTQRHWPAIEANYPRLLPADPPAPVPAGILRIERLFGAADWLALHFRQRVRMNLQATHLAAALMGLAFIVYSDLAPRRELVIAFLALFVLGYAVAWIGQRRQWQRKYLDYRGLSEGLRVQLYWRLAGVQVPADGSLGYDSFLQKQDVELSWIRHAMRGTSLVQDSGAPSDSRWLHWTVQNWVGDAEGDGGQLAYFRHGSQQRATAYLYTERLGRLALLAGLGGALVLALAGPGLDESSQAGLVIFMGLLPLIAGIREAYSFKKADKELIKQFQFMARLFTSCSARLARAASDEERRELLLALGRACLEEHAEWILLHRDRPLELQGPQ
ncbi:hypothetical protein [Arenimonas donghaensis]|uniref:SMODS and SLOG-associating 2TM effector domain-containing protein n=1 Tax=Arenimonas donghaensis DSM 18148 = HO3-R19 TaxID=1121014 RepID=A0A087MLW4_9GAMM|nr:hypothetical protein [Arenimonas donghaensis]KFL37867.1 hypothetical protein N788_01480 [Arenimonas donghaensis DSM 18148 = HO3-R19]